VGVSVFPECGPDAPTLQRHADLAMYQAKLRRAGVAVFRPEMNRDAQERLQLGSDLRRALEAGELEVHYQPQVHLDHGRVVGVEALVRWRHPRLGLVPPVRFVPLAEESGLIVALGAWVMREACLQTVRWQLAGRTDLRVAVNVSPRQFERRDFVDSVASLLAETGLPPACLELELTESVVMRDVVESAVRMEELRELGVSVAVDDFGTGYSSLSYLQRLPLTVLKIDRSFIRALGHERGALPVVRAIAGLAGNLGLTTIAEGVETTQELEVLRDLGVPLVQGYLFARPVPASEVTFEMPRLDPGDSPDTT
jgi:EAL domain-containing protein (putative c-di-GMP-specific phosphodiesterase class I)